MISDLSQVPAPPSREVTVPTDRMFVSRENVNKEEDDIDVDMKTPKGDKKGAVEGERVTVDSRLISGGSRRSERKTREDDRLEKKTPKRRSFKTKSTMEEDKGTSMMLEAVSCSSGLL